MAMAMIVYHGIGCITADCDPTRCEITPNQRQITCVSMSSVHVFGSVAVRAHNLYRLLLQRLRWLNRMEILAPQFENAIGSRNLWY